MRLFDGREISPYFPTHANTEMGSRVDPVLIEVTCGGKKKSRILHTKEGNLYQEYRTDSVSKNCVNGMCIYSRRPGVMCPAKTKFRPKRDGLIVAKPQNDGQKQVKYKIDFDVDPNGDDWEVVPGSGKGDHSPFCMKQVPRNERTYDEEKLVDPNFQVRRMEKMKYCRNGRYSPMQRSYRTEHTGMAEVSGRYEMDTVSTAWGMVKNHGLRFPAKMSNLELERKSSIYHQTKNQSLVDGLDENILFVSDTDENDMAIRCELIRPKEQTEKFGSVPIYLDKDLKYLKNSKLCADGTFSVVNSTNVPYSQIYILTNSFEYLGSTFNMPVAMFLMKRKTMEAYEEILELLKKKYKTLHGEELTIQKITCDAEPSFINAVKSQFPETEISLCSVHIMRCIMGHLKKKVTANWYSNPVLIKAWRVISGCLFLNLRTPEVFSAIETFLKITIHNELLESYPDLAPRFAHFLEYLYSTYFGEQARFGLQLFQYYSNMTEHDDFNTTTNPIESINSQLKRACHQGHISWRKSLKIINDFKSKYLTLSEHLLVNNNMNRRKSTTVNRQNELKDIVTRFSNLFPDQQALQAVDIAFTIGSFSTVTDFSNFHQQSDEQSE